MYIYSLNKTNGYKVSLKNLRPYQNVVEKVKGKESLSSLLGHILRRRPLTIDMSLNTPGEAPPFDDILQHNSKKHKVTKSIESGIFIQETMIEVQTGMPKEIPEIIQGRA